MAWVPSVGVGVGGTACAWALRVPPVRNASPATAEKAEASQEDRAGFIVFNEVFILSVFFAGPAAQPHLSLFVVMIFDSARSGEQRFSCAGCTREQFLHI